MAKIPIKILDSKDVKNFNRPDITCFNFDVLGKTLQFCCKITEEQARLANIVPLARMVSGRNHVK